MTREKAIEALNEIFDDSEYSRYEAWYGTAMELAIEALKQPKQKKGKWIECERVEYTQFHPDYSSSYSTFRCTSCLKANDRAEKYCPNCGAKMEVKV